MSNVRDTTITSVNGYIDNLRVMRTPDQIYRVTCATFNSHGVRYRYSDLLLEEVPMLTSMQYAPNYDTPLYDATADVISTMQTRIMVPAARVLFAIVTDGENNCSVRWTKEGVQGLVGQKQRAGWTFLYLGADMEKWQAHSIAQNLGIAAGNTMSFGKHDTIGVMRNMAQATQHYSAGTALGQSSTDFYKSHGNAELDKMSKK